MLRRRGINFRFSGLYAELSGRSKRLGALGCRDQGFGRHGCGVERASTHAVLFDEDDASAEHGGLEGSCDAARACADDADVCRDLLAADRVGRGQASGGGLSLHRHLLQVVTGGLNVPEMLLARPSPATLNGWGPAIIPKELVSLALRAPGIKLRGLVRGVVQVAIVARST